MVVDGIPFKPNIPITGVAKSQDIDGGWDALTEYISNFYKFTIGIAAILSVIMITVSGLMWLTAGGNASQVGKAKQWIGGAITGLVLVLLSYSILNIINPNIVALKLPRDIDVIAGIKKGCSWQKASCNTSYQTKADDDSACGKDYYGGDRNCCCSIESDGGCCYSDTTGSTGSTEDLCRRVNRLEYFARSCYKVGKCPEKDKVQCKIDVWREHGVGCEGNRACFRGKCRECIMANTDTKCAKEGGNETMQCCPGLKCDIGGSWRCK